MKLYHDAERVNPTGNIASAGILNQLGRPRLDTLAVLVREAVQNSWDARHAAAGSVRFSINGSTLSPGQRAVLTSCVFADCPPAATLSLAACLQSSQEVQVLTISDRGTTGLTGPTRADIATPDGEPRDFVDFLRDVGQVHDRQFAGGTYGYGKTAFYRTSQVRTLCVYTRCRSSLGLESRFIAVALGNSYTASNIRFTGRHWWGRQSNMLAEPLLNGDADTLASQIGLPGFRNDECGTTIMVVQPLLTEVIRHDLLSPAQADQATRTLHQACQYIAECLLWYCWPKMLSYDTKAPPMQFVVACQGEPILLPDPRTFPPLQGFMQAMSHLKGQTGRTSPFRHTIVSIESQRPTKYLGKLTLQLFPTSTEQPFDTGSDELLFQSLTHHTAVMRQPELVVKYVAGPALPNEQLGYSGVFVTAPEVDAIFAGAEPPTHDTWIPQALTERSQRTYVNVALRNIEQEMTRFAQPATVIGKPTDIIPLGAFANRLGDSLLPLIPGPTARSDVSSISQGQINTKLNDPPISTDAQLAGGESSLALLPSDTAWLAEPGATPQYTPLPNTQPPAFDTPLSTNRLPLVGRAHVRMLSEGELILIDGAPALRITFIVTPGSGTIDTQVHIEIAAVLDGNQWETEPPIGGSRAYVLQWIAPEGTTYPGMPSINVPAHSNGNWQVHISVPGDMVLAVELRATAGIQA
ncbi:MAG: hypothetical protein H0X37_03700 [Herpetosiphonaceae bacterium]|nr:hypothetical protein [Herpetosiphonaceae bacterium]